MFKGGRRGSRGGVPGVIPVEIASGRCCAAGEAGKKGLTRGPALAAGEGARGERAWAPAGGTGGSGRRRTSGRACWASWAAAMLLGRVRGEGGRGLRVFAGWGGKEGWAASGWAERKGTGRNGLIAGLPGLIAGPNGSVGMGWAREEGLGWVWVFLFYF